MLYELGTAHWRAATALKSCKPSKLGTLRIVSHCQIRGPFLVAKRSLVREAMFSTMSLTSNSIFAARTEYSCDEKKKRSQGKGVEEQEH